MHKIMMILNRIHRRLIFLFDGLNTNLYMKRYIRYLKNQGLIMRGVPKYICHSAFFDGVGYNKIAIGDGTVISREVMLLCHDYSPETALLTVGKGGGGGRFNNKPEACFISNITIGNNVFIGARASLLPGTVIGDNCIIGACAVVKGHIPDNSVVIGNPCKIFKSTNVYAKELINKQNYQMV